MRENKNVAWHQTLLTGIMLVKLLPAHTTQLCASQTYSSENDGMPHVTEAIYRLNILLKHKHIIKSTPLF
jgi:hypothetical protein